MTYLPTQEDLTLLTSRSKNIYTRIELLDKDYQIIDSIDGLALSGSYSIDADSDTRRTFNLDIFPQKGFSVSQFEVEDWTTKMLRLYIGMKAPTSEPYNAMADNGGMSETAIKNAIKINPVYRLKQWDYTKKVWHYTAIGVSHYGNIDNINRPRIMWTKDNMTKYADFIKENDYIVEGDYSTVCGCDDKWTVSIVGDLATRKYQIAYTPMFVYNDEIIPLLQADVETYIDSLIKSIDTILTVINQFPAKLLELDATGIDMEIYGRTIRVKNLIAAIEGGVIAGKTLSDADVSAIAGWSKDELQKEYKTTSWFVGKSMHDIQSDIWELKDGMEQIQNFYYAFLSSRAKVRSDVNYVDTDGVHWFGEGVYAIQQNGYSYDASTNKLSLSCLDLTCLLDGTLGGTLTGYATRIPMYDRKMTIVDGTKTYVDDKTKPHYVRASIKETFELSGLTKSMVDYWVRRIPHDLEYSTGTTIWNILTELRDLYYPFELYFDDDTFVCKEIPSGYDDPVVLDEDTFNSLVISEDASVDYSQIHNCVEVWGASNSSDYFCKNKLEKDDPEGTGIATLCKYGTEQWNTVVKLLNDNKLNLSYNIDPSNTGACILLLELTQATIQDGTKISFVCPGNLPADTRVVIKNTITTTELDSATNMEYKKETRQVYGPMMVYKASTNEDGVDEPEDTTKMLSEKYYVIKYGTQYIDQAKEGAFSYVFDASSATYKKVELDPDIRYYTKTDYDTETGRYVTKYYKYQKGVTPDIELSDPAVIQESRVYFLGQSQSHAMAKFVDKMPSAEEIAADKIAEACDNLEYIVVNDPQRTDSLYNSRFTIDKIGRRNLICSGSEYEGYTSDESAMTVCKYMLWKNCRLTDSITLKMHLVPWLDVNEKIKYAAKYLNSKTAVEWLIKKIDTNIGEGTMSVTLSRYYPYYPYITYQNTLVQKYVDNGDKG